MPSTSAQAAVGTDAGTPTGRPAVLAGGEVGPHDGRPRLEFAQATVHERDLASVYARLRRASGRVSVQCRSPILG